jgi:hypothetical protein
MEDRDQRMSLAAALIYWVIIALWLAVLATVGIAFVRNPRTFGTTRLLLSVLTIDTFRNVAENLYFGLYFGGQYGLFPASIVGVLGKPNYLTSKSDQRCRGVRCAWIACPSMVAVGLEGTIRS